MGDEYEENDFEEDFADADEPDEMEEIEEGAEEGGEQENVEILPMQVFHFFCLLYIHCRLISIIIVHLSVFCAYLSYFII